VIGLKYIVVHCNSQQLAGNGACSIGASLVGESVTALADDEAQAGVDGVKIKEISVAGLPSAAVECVMRAADRAMRDERILQLFCRGVAYRRIARAAGLRSPQSVWEVVRRELGHARASREPVAEVGRALFVERQEALLAAH
jgi:hypothetical protein